MFIKKIISSILISVALLMALSIPAIAADSGKTTVSAPVITIDENTAMGKTIDNSSKNSTSNIAPSASASYTYSDAYIIRHSNTTTCDVYLAWSGTILTNDWYFNSMTIKSTSWLFPTTYKTFGSSYHPCDAGTSGAVLIGQATIPTNVSQVSVAIDNLQEYNMTNAYWLSVAWVTTAVNIN